VQASVIQLFFKSLLLATLVALAACETTPPVQEMSDARQAITVAREAGAAEYAAIHLKVAEDYLESAKAALDKGDYHVARRNAKHAKAKALDALHEAEAAAAED
jgi:hypothetical protein